MILVHGEEATKGALNITEQLSAGNIKNLSVKELKQGLRGAKLPSTSRRNRTSNFPGVIWCGELQNAAREDVQMEPSTSTMTVFKTPLTMS